MYYCKSLLLNLPIYLCYIIVLLAHNLSLGMQPVTHNKIVMCISPARSLSTAFLRMMQERKDFAIMHEPFNAIYFASQYNSKLSINEPAYNALWVNIYTTAKAQPLFIKDVIHPITEMFSINFHALKNPQFYFVFLMRNPHGNIISCYKKELSPTYCLESYELSFMLLHKIINEGIRKPLIIFSEDLYKNPFDTVKSFCSYADIDFKTEALNWSDLGDDFNADEWQDNSEQELIYQWHENAIHSTRFVEQTKYEIDSNNKPTFSEISDPVTRRTCFETYEKCMLFYEQIRELA